MTNLLITIPKGILNKLILVKFGSPSSIEYFSIDGILYFN